MDNRRNFYRILRVQPDASSQVIRQSYRSLMQNLRLHSDLCGEHWDASIINQAYATLRDAKKRADYDVELLRRYNILTLSRGGGVMACGSYVRDDSKTSQQIGNQRNYYRVLHVQPDAELAVINASYRALHDQLDGDKQQQLADEAFRVIGDMRLRAQYDALLKSHTHVTCV